MKKRCLMVGVASALSMGSAGATVIVDEDFESYADTAALGGVWALSDGTLDTALGNPGNSLSHPGTSGSFSGGNTNSLSFAEVAPTGTDFLAFSVDIYDDGTSSNKRTTAGLRRASPAGNLLELGMYNAPSHYAYRVILFGSGDPSWAAFENLVDDAGEPIENTPVEGWHTFLAEISETSIELTLDLNGDGNINATASVPISPVDLGFDIVRLGGPSDLSSAGGGANFDNVSLTLVPEPATAALLGLGGLAMLRRRSA
ncbi:MAG: PEP-CTERM sorting domain-containing protein [Planctomycetota bacterium]